MYFASRGMIGFSLFLTQKENQKGKIAQKKMLDANSYSINPVPRTYKFKKEGEPQTCIMGCVL